MMGIDQMSYMCKKCGKLYTYQQYTSCKFCDVCDSFLIKKDGKSKSLNKNWIFQTNPLKFRIHDFWKDYPDKYEMTWAVRQYQKEVRKGHLGIIWLTGNQGGIFGIFKTVTNPSKKITWDEYEMGYWVEKIEILKSKQYPRIKIEYVEKLLDDPITRTFCLNDHVLSDLVVFKKNQGTNFPLAQKHMDRIQEIIRERGNNRLLDPLVLSRIREY